MTGMQRSPGPLDADWDAALAAWLAGVFAGPLSAGAVDSYRHGLGALLLEALDQEPGCAEGAMAMQAALDGSEAADVVTRRLGMAFTQLFEGVGGPHTVSPFESAHVSASGRLFQASSGAMERRLRKARLSPKTGDREPADHVAIELALLSRLMLRGGSAREKRALLDDHLLVWVPGFAAALELHDRTGFYAGAASVLAGFLAERRAALVDRAADPVHRGTQVNREMG